MTQAELRAPSRPAHHDADLTDERSTSARFHRDGYAVLPEVLTEERLAQLESLADALPERPGSRRLLDSPEARAAAADLAAHHAIGDLLGADTHPLLCTALFKRPGADWSVPLHRDALVPVRERIDAAGWSAWSRKEGIDFARPPRAVLARLAFVRVHLEDCTEANAPLHVVPGSHLECPGEREEHERIACPVPRAGALVLRPTLLHGSAAGCTSERRVFQFLLGPSRALAPMAWPFDAVAY